MNNEDFKWDFLVDVRDYIENEKDYIEGDIIEQKRLGYDIEGLAKDLIYLKDLTESDIKNITEKVFYDEQLNETFNELVHYYLYHYKKHIESDNNE